MKARFETCACQYDEPGDDILDPCRVHMLWRDKAIREAEAAARADERGVLLVTIADVVGRAVHVPTDLDMESYARGYAQGKKEAREAIEARGGG